MDIGIIGVWLFIFGVFIGLIYYLPSLPFIIACKKSIKISDKKTLNQKLKFWQSKLGLSKYRIDLKLSDRICFPKIGPNDNGTYLLIFKKGDSEAVIVHELLHIKRKHFNLPRWIHYILNYFLDVSVNLEFISVWSKNRE